MDYEIVRQLLGLTLDAAMCFSNSGNPKLYGANINPVEDSIVGWEFTHKYNVQLIQMYYH